jgi:hypothetical protein
VFDPQEAAGINRGVTYWSDGAGDERILLAAGQATSRRPTLVVSIS